MSELKQGPPLETVFVTIQHIRVPINPAKWRRQYLAAFDRRMAMLHKKEH